MYLLLTIRSSQRFYKLKKESEALTNGMATTSTDANGNGTAPATPAPKGGRGRGGGSAKRKNVNVKAEDGEDKDESAEGTPAKKVKTPAKKTPKKTTLTTEIKAEVKEEDNSTMPKTIENLTIATENGEEKEPKVEAEADAAT